VPLSRWKTKKVSQRHRPLGNQPLRRPFVFDPATELFG
jgi:hypothetical protein